MGVSERLQHLRSELQKKRELRKSARQSRPLSRFRMLRVATALLAVPGATAVTGLMHHSDDLKASHTNVVSAEFLTEKVYSLPSNYAHDLILSPIDQLAAKDGGASVELSPGISLVTYSDSYQGNLSAPTLSNLNQKIMYNAHMLHNCATIVNENTGEVTYLTGQKDKFGFDTSWITPADNPEDKPDGPFYWTKTPFIENDKLFVPLAKTMPDGMFGKYIGSEMAIFDLVNGKPSGRPDIIQLPQKFSETEQTIWGAAILQDTKHGYTYMYGTSEQKQDNPLHTKGLKVIRAPTGKLGNIAKHEAWNGKKWIKVDPNNPNLVEAWQTMESQAVTFLDNVSSNFSADFINGKVVLTKKDLIDTDLFVLVGNSPTGPFKSRDVASNIEALVPQSHKAENAETWIYSPYLHPEKKDPEGKGRILITISLMPKSKVVDTDKLIRDNVNTYNTISLWVDKEKIFGHKTSHS